MASVSSSVKRDIFILIFDELAVSTPSHLGEGWGEGLPFNHIIQQGDEEQTHKGSYGHTYYQCQRQGILDGSAHATVIQEGQQG